MAQDSLVYIYGLMEPDTGLIRYIGKTIRPKERLQNHMNDKTKCHRTNWINSLKDRGMKPEMVFLEAIRGDWPWQYSERYWIAHAKKHGWPLVNGTDGGDGVCGLSGEAKARMASTWVGRKHTEESKKKIGAATSARRHTDATKAKMSAAHTGREITWVAKVSAALRKISDSDVATIKERLSAGEKGRDLAAEYGVHRTTISKIKMGAYYAKFGA